MIFNESYSNFFYFMWKSLLLFMMITNFIKPCSGQLSLRCKAEEEHCFAIHVPENKPHHISGSFVMMEEDLPADPIAVVLFDEHNTALWHSKHGVSFGEFETVGSGRYQLCFGNGSGAYMTPVDIERQKYRETQKTLARDHAHINFHEDDDHYDYNNYDRRDRTFGFRIRVEPMEGMETANGQENPNGSPERALLESITSLKTTLLYHLDHWVFMNAQESNHRDLAEDTFSSVIRWTLLELVVLIIASTAQIWYLKKFFETKRYR